MPSLIYERGEPDYPVGHAFVYFTSGLDEVLASYVVIPPVAIDFSKYVPPLVASGLGASGMLVQPPFLPIPPAPEPIVRAELGRLADLRGDDVIAGGAGSALDLASLMARVAEIGQAYADAYAAGLARVPKPAPAAEPGGEGSLEGLALLYSTLPERERVDELAQRIGKLRYALEVNDQALREATREEMRAIAAYLPQGYQARELIEAASRPDPAGARLAELYIQRGYKLAGDDQAGVESIDQEIASLLGHAR